MTLHSKDIASACSDKILKLHSLRPNIVSQVRIVVSFLLLMLCSSIVADEELSEELQKRALEFAQAIYEDIKSGDDAPDHLIEIWNALFRTRPLLQVTDDEIEKIAEAVRGHLKDMSDAKDEDEKLSDEQLDRAEENTETALKNKRDTHGGI